MDDEPLTESVEGPRRAASVFEDDWALIDELMQEAGVTESDENLDVAGAQSTGDFLFVDLIVKM